MVRRDVSLWMMAGLALGAVLLPAGAQSQQGWQTDANTPGGQQTPANTTVVPRTPGLPKGSGAAGQLTLAAFLTDESQPIQQGLVWRVFRDKGADGKNALVSTHRDPSPVLRLEPGTYQVNV